MGKKKKNNHMEYISWPSTFLEIMYFQMLYFKSAQEDMRLTHYLLPFFCIRSHILNNTIEVKTEGEGLGGKKKKVSPFLR